jgi:hypothetical protein
MTPKHIYVAASLLALCCGRTAWSDDPPKAEAAPDPCITDLTLEKLDNPPQRKTKFEVVDEVRKEKLFDIKAADQKFAAFIRIQLPTPSYMARERVQLGYVSNNLWRDSEKHQPFLQLQVFPDYQLLRPSSRDSRFGTFSDAFRRMIAQIPEDRIPEAARKELSSPDINLSVITFDPARRSGGVPETERGLLILGRTPEEAERRARQLLLIFDQGFSRPLQMALFKERVDKCSQLHEQQKKLPVAKKSHEDLVGKIKEYEEFTPDLLAGLKVQQLQMEVDVAGVKAKIATCERLLAKMAMAELERRKPIEDAKIAAEIELSGFEARRAKAAEFVGKVKDRNELATRAAVAEKAVSDSTGYIGYYSRLIRSIDEEIAAFGPVALVDDRVTIHPLEWTQ